MKPVLDGEEVTVTGEVIARDPQGGVTASLRATTASAGECAALTATLPAGSPAPLNLALYAEAPLPAERGPGTRAYFDAHATLGTFGVRYDAALDRWSGTFQAALRDRAGNVVGEFAGTVVAARIATL